MKPINLSKEMETIANSASIFTICEKIGKDNDLHIDQIGELDAQIRLILRGGAKSENFIEDIKKHLEINTEIAEKIAGAINKEIFQTIKTDLQARTLSESQDISAIERAGNFKIEKVEETYTDPIVDHLLANPATTNSADNNNSSAEGNGDDDTKGTEMDVIEEERAIPKKEYANDPYHEVTK